MPVTPVPEAGRSVLARLDRLPGWPLPWTHLAILGIGYLFTFYELAIGGLASSVVAARFELSVTESLLVLTVSGGAGYFVGSIAVGGLADRRGRVTLLPVAMAIAALGSLAGAVSSEPVLVAAFRILTGIGLGAVVNLTSTYLSEICPAATRGRAGGIVFLTGILGQSLATLLAPAAMPADWRWLSGIGVLLAVTALLVRLVLPESPRWLVQAGKVERAGELLDRMEAAARARGASLPEPEPLAWQEEANADPLDALRQPPYQGRLYLLVAMWFLWYLGTLGFLANASTLLADAGYGGVAAIVFAVAGAAGLPVGAAVMAVIADRLERRILLIGGTAVWLAGMALVAPNAGALLVAAGLLLASIGFGFFLQLAYTFTAESFPMRARASGFGISDGAGHVGGALGALALPVIVAATSFQFGLVAMGVTGLAAGVLALAGPRATGRRLEDVSG